MLVKSPGVPREAPLVAEAARRGIPVWSEVELGFRLLRTAAHRRHRHERQDDDQRAARRDARRAASPGNVGRALTELDGEVEPAARRLRAVELPARGRRTSSACEVAVLLNLEPDHLDRHGSLRGLPRGQAAHLRAGAARRSCRGGAGPGRGIEFSADDPLPAEPLIPGAHNRENAAAATAAARAARRRRRRRSPRRSRRSPACRTGSSSSRELHGVRFVNDSKATNVAAARRAIAAYADAPLHLILGGSRKGEDFDALARGARRRTCAAST